MATITLRHYLEQITQLLEDSQFDEAAHHCRYILQQYPRHLDTYRLLGKTYLEQHRFSEAVDLFQRVLSADPNDFIAHVGLAIAHKNESLLPNAIWYMERAYEMDPYNMAVRDELLDLYRINGDAGPDRFGLTRSALARLYLKGELYQQAVDELHHLLAEDPERIDLELLLVEALWHVNQRIEVNERCLRIVEEMPYCLAANGLLANIWLQNGRLEEARLYLQRLQDLTQPERDTLDADSIVGWAFTNPGAPELPKRVQIEPMTELVRTREVDAEDAAADWVEAVPSEEGETYDWLGEVDFGQEPPPVAEADAELEAEPIAEAPVERKGGTDWFFDQPYAEETDEDDDAADWLDAVAEEPAVAEADDDWLGLDDEETAVPVSPIIEAWPDEQPFDTVEEVPDWLGDLDDEAFEPERADPALVGDWVSGVTPADDDWLEQLDDSTAGIAAGGSPLPMAHDSDLPPDWLMTGPLKLADTDEVEDDENPDWFMTGPLPSLEPAASETEDWAEEQEESEWADAGETPDWLMSGPLPSLESATGEAEDWAEEQEESEWADAGETPDWLMSGPLPSLESATSEAEDWAEEQEESEWADAGETPDWLMSGPLTPPDEPAAEAEDTQWAEIDQLPDWLLTGPLNAGEAPLPEEDTIEAADWDDETEGEPDWLMTGLLDEESAAEPDDEVDTAVAEERLPDWIMTDQLSPTDQAAADDPFDVWGDVEEETNTTAVEPEAAPETDEDVAAAGIADNWLTSGPLVEDYSYTETGDLTTEELLADYDIDALADEAESDDVGGWLEDSLEADLPAPEPESKLSDAGTVDFSTDDILGTDEETELPDWLFHSEAEFDLDLDDSDTSPLRDLDEISTGELTGEAEGDIPDWLMLSGTDLLPDDADDEVDDNRAALDKLSDVSTGELLGEDDDELLPDWSLTEEERVSGGTAPLSDLDHIKTDDLLGVETGVNLPDWLLQTDSDLLVGSDWTEDEEQSPVEFSTSDILREGEEDHLPDWMVRSVADNLDELLVEAGESTELPEISTEDLLEEADDEQIGGLLSRLEMSDTTVPPIPSAAMEEAVIGDSDEMDKKPDDFLADEPDQTPDDLDEAFAWLEQFDDEEETAVSDDDDWLPDEELDLTLPPAEPVRNDSLPDWLMDLAPEQEDEESLPTLPSDPLALDSAGEETESADDMLDWLQPVPDTDELRLPPDEPTLTADRDETIPGDTSALDWFAAEAADDDELDWLSEMATQTEADDFPAETAVVDLDLAQLDVDSGADLTDDLAIPETPEDLDEAMAWLDQLADQQEQEEALDPATLADDNAAAFTDDDDDLLDAVDVPDDIEEAMAWLEQIAADTSLADLSDTDEIAETMLTDDMDLPDWAAMDDEPDELGIDEEDEEEDALTWLAGIAGEESLAEADEPAADTTQEYTPGEIDFDEDEVEAVFDLDETAEPETAVSFDPDPADDLEDAMAWLEQLAAEQEEADDRPVDLPAYEVEEAVPTQPDVEPEPDDLDALLDRLEQQALADTPPDLELDPSETAVEPDDALADALDWLEQTALAPLPAEPSLPSTVAATAEMDTAPFVETATPPIVEPPALPEAATEEVDALAFDEMPEDPDEVMAWLERLAARQGASPDELPSVTADEAATIAQMPIPSQAPEISEPLAEVDAETGQVVAPPAPEPEDAEPPVAVETTPSAAAAFTDDVPEDPDEAMAWLERLAARQGAALDELPSVDVDTAPDVLPLEERGAAYKEMEMMEEVEESEETTEATELADFFAETTETAEIVELPAETEVPDVGQPMELGQPVELDQLPELAEPPEPETTTEPLTGLEPLPDFTEAFDEDSPIDISLEEPLDEDLPDWLGVTSERGESRLGETDWLGTLDEPDVMGWLAAEEAARATSDFDDFDLLAEPETDSLVSQPVPAPQPEPEPLFDDLDLDFLDEEIGAAGLDLDEERLDNARQQLAAGAMNEALTTYQLLVEEGHGLSLLIGELETAVVAHHQPLLQRVLGDAYMRNGQLQKALDTYREALDAL